MDRKLIIASRTFLNSSPPLIFRFCSGSIILEFISYLSLYCILLSYLMPTSSPCSLDRLPSHHIPLEFFSPLFWMNNLQIAMLLLYFLRLYDSPLRHLRFFGVVTRAKVTVYCRKFHRSSWGFCGNKFQTETWYVPKVEKCPNGRHQAPPPTISLPAGDILLSLASQSIPTHILNGSITQ